MLLSCIIGASATDGVVANNESAEYQESHFQINLADYDVYVDNGEMNLVAKKSLARSSKKAVSENASKLQEIFAEFPDVKENLISEYQADDELCAVSFTEVPVVYVDGHYERVPVTRGSSTSDKSSSGKFLLYTSIHGGVQALNNQYRYVARTFGSWSNSILGGANYPAAGNDYVLQTAPNTFGRTSDSIAATYDHNPTGGVSGSDFWREDGNSQYVRYLIKDDPAGYRQLKSFTLESIYAGPQFMFTRQIGSYYVHTWNEMTLAVSVSASTDRAITLTLTPSIVSKSWQIYNFVEFAF